MKKDIKKFIAKEIASAYYDILLNGFEENKNCFVLTLIIIEFISKLKENNIDIGNDLDNILSEDIINLMFLEANNYIGKGVGNE